MRRKSVCAASIAAAAIFGFSAVAEAQTRPSPRFPVQGLYIGAGAGMNFRHEAQYSNLGIGLTASPSQPGFAGLVALGYGFGNGLRVEFEGSVRQNSVRDVAIAGISIPGSGGQLRNWGFMVNALADLHTGTAVTPYFGAGLGLAINDWRGVGAEGSVGGISYRLRANGSEPTFAYQAIAGLAYDLSHIRPGLAATAEYRFFGALNPSIGFSASVDGLSASGRFTPGNNYNHSLLFGLRLSLAAPPRPVIPFNMPSPGR